MATFKDLSDPGLRAELLRRAEALKERRRLELETARTTRARDEEINREIERTRSTFETAIGPITPLSTARKTTSRPAAPLPVPRLRQEDEAAALQSSRDAVDPSPMAWDIGLDIEASQSYVRSGLNPDLLRKLRRGEWVVQGSLDLHQHTQEEARSALAEFLAAARRQGWRCVRIIHGKGLSSPNREPVLKGKVRRWLQQRDEVLAYCEPRPHSGGGGAVVVLVAGSVRDSRQNP